jgi:hypothetical protein
VRAPKSRVTTRARELGLRERVRQLEVEVATIVAEFAPRLRIILEDGPIQGLPFR